jgi:hypothetical protein
MKTQKLLKIIALLLIATIAITCDSNVGEIDVPLAVTQCDCDENLQIPSSIERPVLLVDVSKTTEEEITALVYSEGCVKCDFIANKAFYLLSGTGSYNGWHWSYELINFPFDYKWNIPKEGLSVSLKSHICRDLTIIPEHFQRTYCLTSLKILSK